MDKPTSSHPRGNTALIAAIIIGVIVVAGFVYYRNQSSESLPATPTIINDERDETIETPDVTATDPVPVSPTTPTDQPTDNTGEVKTFTVTGKNFSFDPAEMRVKKGDRVKIIFVNGGGFHDWVLDEFNVRTPRISDGAKAEVEFVADKTGTFEYYCSVGNHRQAGMKGNLIVE